MKPIELGKVENVINYGDEVVNVVSKIRAYKSENKLSMKTAFDNAKIFVPKNVVEFVKSVDYDLKAVSSIQNFEFEEGETAVEFGNIIENN